MAVTGSVTLPFADLQLDRGGEHREDGDWLAAAWTRARVIVMTFEGDAAIDPAVPSLHSFDGETLGHGGFALASFLGTALDDGTPWFALPAESLPKAIRDTVPAWQGLRQVATQMSAFDAGLFAYAKALLLWQTRARFCGACGNPTVLRRAGHSARCNDEACRLEHFPRTDAAIIVLVTDADRALIGRQAGWPERRYSTLAGFVEPGETLEDAVRREVAEESGVRVGRCHYRDSQPWPFPASLMVGFRAEARDATITLGDELEDACWIDAKSMLDAVEQGSLRLPMPISISYRLIVDWLLEQADPQHVRRLLPDA